MQAVQYQSPPASSTAKMGLSVITHVENYTPRRASEDAFSHYRPLVHPHTPPESLSGSPRIKPESKFPTVSTRQRTPLTCLPPGTGSFASTAEYSPLPRLARLNTSSTSSIRLPSLEEFDQGVEAIARANGQTRPWTPPSPLPSLRRSSLAPAHPLPSIHSYTPQNEAYSSPAAYTPVSDSYMQGSHLGLESYPSPPPDGENRHINQKYTTEEGDFIIYLWHDKKLKWQRIKQDFASMFGRTPERTVQGLQAWYYRMNQRIPLWDKDGWLIFENEEDLEPKHVSIKCRERDSQDKPMEPLGLAQRYPERAMAYSWVDSELKHKARDWGKLHSSPT